MVEHSHAEISRGEAGMLHQQKRHCLAHLPANGEAIVRHAAHALVLLRGGAEEDKNVLYNTITAQETRN